MLKSLLEFKMPPEIWKLEGDLCRCCHSEGNFTNLAEPREQIDHKEVYCDMLKECFDLNINPVPSLLCEQTYTICEACILRLKDAFDFKLQVQKCEAKFKDFFNRNAIIAAKVGKEEVKDEVPELILDIKDDYSDNYDNVDDNDIIMLNSEEPIKTVQKPKEETGEMEKSKPKVRTRTNNTGLRQKKSEREGKKEQKEKKKGASKGCRITEPSRNFKLSATDDGTVKFVCNTCGKCFKKRDLFVQHYRQVHLKLRRKLHSCYLCSEKVAGHLRAAHLEEKHGVPAPFCGACGRKFAFPNQVLRHQKIYHMGEKRYECDECGRRFASKDLLAQHTVSHSNLRSFKCQFCEKSFKRAKNLKTHVMIHLNDKRHACSLCKQAFVQVSSLKYHIAKRHPESV